MGNIVDNANKNISH